VQVVDEEQPMPNSFSCVDPAGKFSECGSQLAAEAEDVVAASAASNATRASAVLTAGGTERVV
jgi:hypothetical protein